MLAAVPIRRAGVSGRLTNLLKASQNVVDTVCEALSPWQRAPVDCSGQIPLPSSRLSSRQTHVSDCHIPVRRRIPRT